MGIDVWVGSLAQSWLGAHAVVLDLLENPTDLVFPGEERDFTAVHEILRRHPPDDWVEFTPAVEVDLQARVGRFQQRLLPKLGLMEGWDDAVVALEEEVPFEEIRQVAGQGLYRMQVVAARLGAEHAGSDPFEGLAEDPLAPDSVFDAARRGEMAGSFAQVVHLDVNSVFLPLDFPRPLLGLPNRFGSAVRLLSELETLLEQYDSLPREARGFDYELRQLRGRARAAVERSLPLHVEG